MNTQQWVKVTRPDGLVQYATRDERGEFFLYGTGFSIHRFCEGTIVEDIEGCPPNVYKSVMVGFDGMRGNKYRAIVDTNHTWNGWECPWIHESEIKRLVKYMKKYSDCESWTLGADGVVEVKSLDFPDDPADVYEPEVHEYDGEKYYYFGGMYTWMSYDK